jgi:RNA polymerase sigma-70 factor (ECF subfamily)
MTRTMTHPVVADRTIPGIDAELLLVERARDGDRHAFDRLVAARLPQTYRLAKAITGHAGDAEDVTQEAFLQAWRNLPRLREPARFDAWFGRIVVNAARMALRRRDRVMTVPVDSIDVHDDDGRRGHVPSAPDPSIDAVAHNDALQRAINRITVEQRTILALHHLEERPVTEIAALLGIPVGTAKWRLYEARAALERAMETQR